MSIPEEKLSVLMRFQRETLTGKDLAIIRSDILGLTQEELGRIWGRTRSFVGREETKALAGVRTADQYRGLLLRKFLLDSESAVLASQAAGA